MRERKDSSKTYGTSILIEVSILSVISPCGEHRLFARPEKVYFNVFLFQPTPTQPPIYVYLSGPQRATIYFQSKSDHRSKKSEIKLIFCIAIGVVKLKSTRNLKDE